MLKQLTYTYSALTQTDLGTFDNDAKACYDRILINSVSFRNQQLAMHPNACRLCSRFLTQAKYRIKKQLGVSNKHYLSTESHCPYGVGKGSKPAGIDWRGQSTTNMDLMDGTPLTMVNPKRIAEAKQILDGFVDDITEWMNFLCQLIEDAKATNPPPNIVAQLEYITQ